MARWLIVVENELYPFCDGVQTNVGKCRTFLSTSVLLASKCDTIFIQT
jgi:hypothetical protein